MSGRKQHFIPQSLLKGFSRRGSGKKAQVAVYGYGRPAFWVATDGIAAERNFYSEYDKSSQSETLDDRITAHETPLSKLLQGLRSLESGDRVEASEAAELVTHLVIRNDNFRKTVIATGSKMFAALGEATSDADMAFRMMGLDKEAPSDDFAQSLESSWRDHGHLLELLGFTKESFIRFTFDKAKADWAELHPKIAMPMQDAMSHMTKKLPEMASDAQRRALSAALIPERWIERLGRFVWKAIESDGDIILPDSVAVAFNAEGQATPLVFSEEEGCQHVVLPLSVDRYIVGSITPHEWQASDLNAGLAGCAWDFFISSEISDANMNHQKAMRINIENFIKINIEEILNSSLN